MLKLKHALWFAAAVGNMQFSQHGRWAHPYPGISPTPDNVGMFYPKIDSVPSIDPH